MLPGMRGLAGKIGAGVMVEFFFDFRGNLTVPPGYTSARFSGYGPGGWGGDPMNDGSNNGPGGGAAAAQTVRPVTPGEVYGYGNDQYQSFVSAPNNGPHVMKAAGGRDGRDGGAGGAIADSVGTVRVPGTAASNTTGGSAGNIGTFTRTSDGAVVGPGTGAPSGVQGRKYGGGGGYIGPNQTTVGGAGVVIVEWGYEA